MNRGTCRAVGVVLVAMLAFVTPAGCSSSKKAEPTKRVTDGKITVGAYDIRFDVGKIETSPGPLAVTLVNHGAMFHDFVIEGTDLELKTDAGKTATGTVTLEKGTYNFECTVSGHAAQGMKGTIVVG